MRSASYHIFTSKDEILSDDALADLLSLSEQGMTMKGEYRAGAEWTPSLTMVKVTQTALNDKLMKCLSGRCLRSAGLGFPVGPSDW